MKFSREKHRIKILYGYKIIVNDYILVEYTGHPKSRCIGWRDYVPLHVLKMEYKINRYLNLGKKKIELEAVHHKDLNSMNNKFSNLELMMQREHLKLHIRLIYPNAKREFFHNKEWLYQKYIIEDMSSIKIAKICKCTSVTIGFWIRKFGFKKEYNRHEYYKNKKWLYKKYIIEDMSSIKIAKICKSSDVTINKWIRKFNIKKIYLYKDKKWLYKKYINEDFTMNQISKICNCSETAIQDWINKFNIKKVKIKKYTNKVWLYKKYINEDLSVNKISKICNCNYQTIYNWLDHFDIRG